MNTPKNISTSLQVLAALAVGGALLATTTSADAARGGFRSAPARSAPARSVSLNRAPAHATTVNRPSVLPAATSARRSNARGLFSGLGSAVLNEVKTVGGDITSGKITKIPGDVVTTGSKVAGAVVSTGVGIFTQAPPKLPTPPTSAQKPVKVTGQPTTFGGVSTAGTGATGSAKPVKVTGQPKGPVFVPTQGPVFTPTQGPVFVPTGTASKTGTTTATTSANGFQFVQKRIEAARQAAANLPSRQQIGGRGGFATSAPTMSPGPGAVSQPAPVAPVATQPSAPAPVQPSCLRQAVTQEGQVVTFDICNNQAVVGPLAQMQTQPQTQTQ